ncbi:MAG: tRNA dihydrouridine(20/20a) synthase DusA [Cyanobacteria bacterium QS_8_64_29]|nr:MAG: tRNA dihydrouridine(20/20a) synthase DusA [Cyanobacteria bacterium QS_8_64_29]
MPDLASSASPNHAVSVAPMMDRTDRHFRYFMRQLTRRTLLYTEMVTAAAIRHGDRERLLGFDERERPLALQIGGIEPAAVAECARIAQDWGYDELNLNVGCPSDRVQQGELGACLMAQPERVARAVSAMRAATTLPVTVKHRIGIDNQDRYADLARFVRIVAEAGCQRFTVHARKAWLQGLSPRENRNVPPLRHAEIHQLKREFPHLTIETNGGITTLAQIQHHLRFVDAVMMGRVACDDPYLLAFVDRYVYGDASAPSTRQEAVEAMLPYIDEWMARGAKLVALTQPMLNLFCGRPGAKAWRCHLSENAHRATSGSALVREALARVAPAAPEPDSSEQAPKVEQALVG